MREPPETRIWPTMADAEAYAEDHDHAVDIYAVYTLRGPRYFTVVDQFYTRPDPNAIAASLGFVDMPTRVYTGVDRAGRERLRRRWAGDT